MNTRIDRKFAELKKLGRKGFIAYITAGDPSPDRTPDMVFRLEKAGADVVELGIPFSDPLADGRVNQESAERALAAGTTLDRILSCVVNIRKNSDIPILFFSYLNPLEAYGLEKLAGNAAEAGVDGFLILDLPVEEGSHHRAVLDRHGLNHVCLATPTSPEERLKRIVRNSTGFVYGVSRTGVTGMQRQLENDAVKLVTLTRKYTDIPLALGFGISTPEQARQAARLVDAVVVGSAIVDRFHREAQSAAGRKRAAAWVKKLIRAVKEV